MNSTTCDRCATKDREIQKLRNEIYELRDERDKYKQMYDALRYMMNLYSKRGYR